MKIAFYGSSLLSSYWNGAATYYRGLLRALAQLGYEITFYEPAIYDRQNHRDMAAPDWCAVAVYEATPQSLMRTAALAAQADIVIKASGVGYEDDAIMSEVLRNARPNALTAFWDVDAPATLAQLRSDPYHPLRRMLRKVDLVLTYGGGEPVIEAYRALGAAHCVPIYNALDPATHHRVSPAKRFASDLSFLGNRLPDRERRVEALFLEPAGKMPENRFLIGGAGWGDKPLPDNVCWTGHLGADEHNAFNATAKAVLNISRESMASNGFSPATRIFEAAGAGACLISDDWEGIELFLKPGEQILVVRDGKDVVEAVSGLTRQRARQIGNAALKRVLSEHTYDRRARLADTILRGLVRRKMAQAAE